MFDTNTRQIYLNSSKIIHKIQQPIKLTKPPYLYTQTMFQPSWSYLQITIQSTQINLREVQVKQQQAQQSKYCLLLITTIQIDKGINITKYQLDKVIESWSLQQQLLFQFTYSSFRTLEFFLQQSMITREVMKIQLKSQQNKEITLINPIDRLINSTPIKWQKNLFKLIHLRAKDITQQSSLFEFKLDENRISIQQYIIDPARFFFENLPQVKLKISQLTMIDYHYLDNFNQFTLGHHVPTSIQFGETIPSEQGEKITIKSYKNILQGQHHESRKDRAGCLIRKILLIQHMRKYQFTEYDEASQIIQNKIKNLIKIDMFGKSIRDIDFKEKKRKNQSVISKEFKSKLLELQQQYKSKRFSRNMNQKDLFKILLGREFSQFDRNEGKSKTYITDTELSSTPLEIRILLIMDIIKTKLKQSFKCCCNICNIIIQSRQDFTYYINNQQLYQVCQTMISSISSKSKKSEVPSVYYQIIHENLYHLTKSPAQLIINDSQFVIDSLIVNDLINLFIEINTSSPEISQSVLFKKFALPSLTISPTDNFILIKVLSQLQLNDAILDPFIKDNGLIDFNQLKKYMTSVQDECHDQ